MTTPDPVDQARAWLEEKTGQRVSVEPIAGDSRPVSPPPAGAGGAAWGSSGSGSSASERSGSSSRRAASGRASSGRQRSGRRSSTRRSFGLSASAEGHDDPEPPEPDADPVEVARTIAFRKLAASARTRHELDTALQKKNVPDRVAATVLDRLEEVGLVNDEAFAQSWVESRQQRRHLSRSALRRELSSKGVDRDHVDAALATVDVEDELTAARALAIKKAAATRGLDPVVRHRRLVGVLARRGFGSGVIATVLAELRDDDVLDPAQGAP